mgnify:FL=1|jgi:hypothetical protein
MKEFDYGLDYKQLDFTDPETRKLYRIGRGEQGVLLVRPYTNDICAHWRFVDETAARKSADKIYQMYLGFKTQGDFIGMDMARKFLEMGFTRARRYANHSSGRKYDKTSGKVRPQEKDWRTSTKAKSAAIFKQMREKVTSDAIYQSLRKQWRASE